MGILIIVIIVGGFIAFYYEYRKHAGNVNESGVHEIPQDIGEEIERGYDRELTEKERADLDEADKNLDERSWWQRQQDDQDKW